MTARITFAVLAFALAGCGNGVSDSCVRSETGGLFTSNVDGEGRLYYSCSNPSQGYVRTGATDAQGHPLYVRN